MATTTKPSLPSNWPTDITTEDIQSYLQLYYASTNAPKHQELEGTGNRCEAPKAANANAKANANNSQAQAQVQTQAQTKASTDVISFPQSVVNVVMKGIAQSHSTNRGLLVWWSTGSGKACCATGVMEAFWDTPKNIVFATSVEAFNSNPPSNFHKCASRFFPRFKGMSMASVGKEFERRGVKFFTFAQLAHFLLIANPLKRVQKNSDVEKHQNFLKDAVLIIDEVHNIFKPLPNQKLENTALKEFLLQPNNPYTTDLKIAILTATPGDTPDDVVSLLNMVRDQTHPPITVPTAADPSSLARFEESVRGIISFFDMSKDYTKFPKVVQEFPEKVPMSYKQYKRYVQAYNEEPNSLKNANALLKDNQIRQYYKHARRYSNMLYEMDKDVMFNEFSSKLPALLENIAKYPTEKHYVYSSFYENRGYGGHGILAIAKALEEHMGYVKLSAGQSTTPAQKRYVLAISNELSESREKLKTIVTAFNQPENKNGELIHVFLASQGYNEGVDLRGVKHVHIFEPLLTFAADKQTIGRAARYCSHSDLDWNKGEWTVKIHRYISTAPYDLSMFNMNYLRGRLDYLREETAGIKSKADAYKGAYYKTLRDTLIQEVSEYEIMIKDLEKRVKEVEKLNIQNVQMIDEQISREALERTKVMLAIQKAMKRASIDYLLFREFHGL